MLRQTASVELITHEHRFVATVDTRGKRMLDVLNNRASDFLTIYDVSVYRYSALDKAEAAFDEAIIRKSDIHLAIITHEDYDSSPNRLYGFVQKTLFHVFLTVPGYEVQGTMHLQQSQKEPDPIGVLANELSNFFPVTQASISDAWRGREVFALPVVMVNKGSLSLFSLAEEPIERKSQAEEAAPPDN